MLCVLTLYINVGTYNLKSTLNDGLFEKIFMAISFTLRVFAGNLLRGNRRRNPGYSSNKPTHYLLDHGDFIIHESQNMNESHTNTEIPTKWLRVYSACCAVSFA